MPARSLISQTVRSHCSSCSQQLRVFISCMYAAPKGKTADPVDQTLSSSDQSKPVEDATPSKLGDSSNAASAQQTGTVIIHKNDANSTPEVAIADVVPPVPAPLTARTTEEPARAQPVETTTSVSADIQANAIRYASRACVVSVAPLVCMSQQCGC